MVSGLRSLAQPKPPQPVSQEERCDLCQTTVPSDHRHMLNLYERQIVCVCESCWALRSGDAEFRPTGNRTPTVTVAADDVEGSAPLTVQFTSTVSDPEGRRLKYAWDFDADGDVDSRQPNPSHTFTEEGVYRALVWYYHNQVAEAA